MRKDYKQKTHLMYQDSPSSFCGRYLPNFPGMRQTFYHKNTDCGLCKKSFDKMKKYMLPFNGVPYLKIPLEDRSTAWNVALILKGAMTVDEWVKFTETRP